MSRTRTYLEQLPKHAQKRGSAARGEVEIDGPEESEAFGRIHRLRPGEMADRILRGDVRDNYTIVALLLAQLKGFIRAPRRVGR